MSKNPESGLVWIGSCGKELLASCRLGESGTTLDPGPICYLAREAVLQGVLVEALWPAQETPEMLAASLSILQSDGPGFPIQLSPQPICQQGVKACLLYRILPHRNSNYHVPTPHHLA